MLHLGPFDIHLNLPFSESLPQSVNAAPCWVSSEVTT